ncbi:hypothetical protein CMI47_14055 [Candidatus Pacearchaeota archaeon]|jgi:hypothetical protein|nr:hypothetical protein [Candidatus Pacearchaeota archaeon]|tara:strand:+ start:17811 stop:18050 length:240 start_codon:yes stop_codon:yes gene_type:complete
MVIKTKLKRFTTTATLFNSKGKVIASKYPIHILARSKQNAIQRAKAYHSTWNRGERQRRGKNANVARFVGIRKLRKLKR